MARCVLISGFEELQQLFEPPPTPKSVADLKCPNCGAELELKNSRFGPFYGCATWRATKCRGSVRANPDGSPVGVPVDDATKDARMAAHDVFDQLWKGGRMTRRGAYSWLAEQMKLPPDKAHIGLFSKEQCERMVELIALNLTEDEQLELAERDLMGDTTAVLLDEEDRLLIEALPRDRDALGRKFRGGYVRADHVCKLLRISIGADEITTIRNVFDALREYDRQRKVAATVNVSFLSTNQP